MGGEFAFDADSRVTATGTGGVYAAELTRNAKNRRSPALAWNS